MGLSETSVTDLPIIETTAATHYVGDTLGSEINLIALRGRKDYLIHIGLTSYRIGSFARPLSLVLYKD